MPAAAAAPATATAAKASPVKPWHCLTHLRRLFAPRPVRPGAESWAALDGWRGVLCIWMVCFHTFFFLDKHMDDDAFFRLSIHPALSLLTLGFLPVDGFFVLTGFLIAAPLFKEEKKKMAQMKAAEEAEAEASSSSSSVLAPAWKFDLSTFYYRRVTRMLPSYILALFFFCQVLNPSGYELHLRHIRSDDFKNFMARVLEPPHDALPSKCSPGMLLTNVLWINHLMPFGGCMGWTWSFGLQWNFYIFFALAWWWAHRKVEQLHQARAEAAKRAQANGHANGSVVSASSDRASSRQTPSSFLLPLLCAFLVVSVLTRIVTFLFQRRFDIRHEETLFLGFFWYTNTITRGGGIVWGVLIAHLSVHRMDRVQRIKSTVWGRALVSVGWVFCLAVLVVQMTYLRVYGNGDAVETPGFSSLINSQVAGGADSIAGNNWLFHPQLAKYPIHAFFHVFCLIGSPGSNGMFAFALLGVIHSLGTVGRTLNRILSHPVWYPFSTLSWWVYLMHPALMVS